MFIVYLYVQSKSVTSLKTSCSFLLAKSVIIPASGHGMLMYVENLLDFFTGRSGGKCLVFTRLNHQNPYIHDRSNSDPGDVAEICSLCRRSDTATNLLNHLVKSHDFHWLNSTEHVVLTPWKNNVICCGRGLTPSWLLAIYVAKFPRETKACFMMGCNYM